jgi:hypothetical protein
VRLSGSCCRSSQLSRGEQREHHGRRGRQRGAGLRETTRGETPGDREGGRAQIRGRERAQVERAGEEPESDAHPDQCDPEGNEQRLADRIREVVRAEPTGDEDEAECRLEDAVRSDD